MVDYDRERKFNQVVSFCFKILWITSLLAMCYFCPFVWGSVIFALCGAVVTLLL